MKKNNTNLYDVTAHLVERFGPIGSDTWKEEESRAWEEYNAEILREARKEAVKLRISTFTDNVVEKLKPAYAKVTAALPFGKDEDADYFDYDK